MKEEAKQLRISESEWIIMETLWMSSPKTAQEIKQETESTSGWALNTVRTMLTRLDKKGLVVCDKNVSGTMVFSPSVEREDCVAIAGQSFARRFFGGAAKPLLTHFAQNGNLTAEDVEELKQMLDHSIKEGK